MGALPAFQVLLLVRELLPGFVGLSEALADFGHLDVIWESVPMVMGPCGEACFPAVLGWLCYDYFHVSYSGSWGSTSSCNLGLKLPELLPVHHVFAKYGACLPRARFP